MEAALEVAEGDAVTASKAAAAAERRLEEATSEDAQRVAEEERREAHQWAREHHCSPPRFAPTCAAREWRGCTDGANFPRPWRVCTTTFAPPGTPTTCSSEIHDLLQVFYGRRTGTRCAF